MTGTPSKSNRPWLVAPAALLVAILVACGSGGASAPTPSATLPPTPTATPVALGPAAPQLNRILEHIETLSVDIGERAAGSPEEQEAASYAQEQFELWGYDVEVQRFTVHHDMLRRASVTAQGREIEASSFVNAAAGAVTARLVDAGTGEPGDFPPEASGAAVLIQRQDVPFSDMARRAEQAGAVAVVVANREPGRFFGFVDPPTALPIVAIDRAEGDSLRSLLARAPLEVTVAVEEAQDVTSRNVFARPPDGRCRTVSGGHYDSVPWAPGAGDNASGAATVLELARAAAAAHLSGHCFALFGAEEIGLKGSGFLVSQLDESERAALVAMYNFDVTAGGDAIDLVGSEEVVGEALTLARRLGISAGRSELTGGADSDHSSFIDAGIPSVLLTSTQFEQIHTAADAFANLEAGALPSIASLGFALLQESGP